MEKDFYAEYYALESSHWWFIGRRRIFQTILDQRLRDRAGPLDILDFGCGTGALLHDLAEYGNVHGVDGDCEAIRFCQRRGCADVLHVPADQSLPFPDASFDLVTSFDVLEHIEDDGAALGELWRVLRPGGILFVAVPAFRFLWGDQDEISHHYRRYRAPELVRRLQQAGLRVERTSYFNTVLFAGIASTRLIRRLWRPPSTRRSDFSVGPRTLNRALSWLFAAEAPIVSRVRFPFGVSLFAVARR